MKDHHEDSMQTRHRGEFVHGQPDFTGKLFGLEIQKRSKEADHTDSPLVHLYVEDDTFWHWKTSFDIFWLDDLIEQLQEIKRQHAEGLLK